MEGWIIVGALLGVAYGWGWYQVGKLAGRRDLMLDAVEAGKSGYVVPGPLETWVRIMATGAVPPYKDEAPETEP